MIEQLEDLGAKPYALSLHTTTPSLGLAISDFNSESRAHTWDLGRDLSSYVHQYLVEFIKPHTWEELGFIAVAKGPGGFTGTRIGLVIARTLGQQLNIPVFTISTLAALAWAKKPQNREKSGVIAVEMPAQRGKVFGGIYEPSPDKSSIRALLPDTVFTPEAWQETLANWQSEYKLIKATSNLAITVGSILELAYLDWQEGKHPHWFDAQPYYGQHPVEN
ncbi:tRNA (adenosine(37)-N6)-threonylcarbamoyltransferase complex dimerization subunit type 1 TsaB [Anabaenopsis tanganyikae CS-531]|uniref:tRNA (Adenosine(37)-N6)-threonylcarbamoyltransferase complex dimerization subunit type 1 TsaB n=2 Tax=Anabaenopsis TaxID=110103 RepID=A0ABT5AVL6_9CYAN|nr:MULTISPECIES: tRNA (adenosine(37)-N6)-threonylcarbamoyltransferase complex dimerization subunit type 1 TsaB [Anabaenopsis]MDB9541364.1 tRNA (adenosine(37)-N6)-threonylcarbamoyltransferase complex dimerization subunit type 1 TsaB [Anabaenopsis arnoldii]MDH6090343.1 tRNA (adenosine(37)-N6)-threonylcarbamoyltransferase complex dimerization subunit type 1 TsaB [Anabaenopsis arnoldii]MDH6098466.1 tRNA (adenosine(37)-N6)-threonylcarbamoyltransferase complex dimerization subunit type 1 TsaB [Anabaen